MPSSSSVSLRATTLMSALLSAREELEHQPVDLVGVLVGRPVAGRGNAMEIEMADHAADLSDEEIGGTKRRIVPHAPQQAHAAIEAREIVQEGPASADLPAVEARVAYAVRLDVHGLLGDAGGIAQHVDEEVVAADLPEKLLIIARLAVAARGPLAEGARREARGRNETQVGDAGPEAPRQVRGNGPAEGESGKAQRSIPGEHLQEETMHEIQVLLARRLAWHRGRRAVRRMVQGVHREALGQRLDVPCPVPPAPHPAVEEHDVGSAPPRARRHGPRLAPGRT